MRPLLCSSCASLTFLLLHCVGDDPTVTPPKADGGAPGDSSVGPVASLKAVFVATGKTHTCALLASPGDIVCWGSNANGELGRSGPASSVPLKVTLPEQAKSVAAGDRFSCATLLSGKTFCWGLNESAQSGRLPLGPSASPGPVVEDTARNQNVQYTKPWSDTQALVAGGEHACALSSLGASGLMRDVSVPFCWGSNSATQLGRSGGIYSDKALIPLLFQKEGTATEPALANYTTRGMALGADFYCAIGLLYSTSGFFEGVYCVGKNDRHQRGVSPGPGIAFGYPATAPGKSVSEPIAIAAGAEHACVQGSNEGGTRGIYCWGAADKGQIGGTTETGTDAVATLVPTLGDAEQLRAGGRNTCVSKGGVVSCWGDSSAGQLGKVDTAPNPQPKVIDGLPAVSSLALGGEHICAIVGGSAMLAGDVRCWGSNRNGQLGDGMDLAAGYAGDPKEQFLRTKPVAVRQAQP
jgi:alpha-tubulin suppressor-like RCC1 family protein